MTWIHERNEWPDFTWDISSLSSKLADVRHRQGYLLGRMEALGFEFKTEAILNTLTTDVVKSSAIEGEVLNPEEARSSIARRLGLDIAGLIPASRNVEGIVEVMINATQNFSSPLTTERLLSWHTALFPAGRSGMRKITVGAWRPESVGDMQVLSGPAGHEKVHFQAPDARRLEKEMNTFLKWFEGTLSLDPVLKAGLAHLWFVTIHPFEDGNGRIARAIADMALARADGTRERYYSMSTQIERERKAYYNALENQQRSTVDVTDWLDWFLDCLGRALDNATEILGNVMYKARFWEHANRYQINDRQRLVLNRMLGSFQGYMNTSKYAKLAKCSTDTALRDIRILIEMGIFVQNQGGGRSTSYRIDLKIPAKPSKMDMTA